MHQTHFYSFPIIRSSESNIEHLRKQWIKPYLTPLAHNFFTICLHAGCFVQSLSHVWLFANPWTAAHQAYLSFTISLVCSHSCLLSLWSHSTFSPSVSPFSSFGDQSFWSNSHIHTWLLKKHSLNSTDFGQQTDAY